VGTDWVARNSTAVLAVPSAIIPAEMNYLINPAHRDFGRIAIGIPEPFAFDPRLRQPPPAPSTPPRVITMQAPKRPRNKKKRQ
jgi:hypothetical protein